MTRDPSHLIRLNKIDKLVEELDDSLSENLEKVKEIFSPAETTAAKPAQKYIKNIAAVLKSTQDAKKFFSKTKEIAYANYKKFSSDLHRDDFSALNEDTIQNFAIRDLINTQTEFMNLWRKYAKIQSNLFSSSLYATLSDEDKNLLEKQYVKNITNFTSTNLCLNFSIEAYESFSKNAGTPGMSLN